MANNAQDSLSQSGNLGICATIYAFATARINPDWISFKAWMLGGVVRVVKLAIADLSALSEQIGDALASGDYVIFLGGIKYQTTEKVLGRIRRDFDSYTAGSGVSDAQAVRGGAAILSQPESPSGDAKTKASAPACKPSARQICKLTTTETGEADFIAQSVPQVESACGADASAVADGLIQAFREALQAELAPIRAALEELSFRIEELAVFAKGNSALDLPESSFPRTKRGRTSVVVGVRKISTPKKQK